jgi:hypothetical protein
MELALDHVQRKTLLLAVTNLNGSAIRILVFLLKEFYASGLLLAGQKHNRMLTSCS